MKLPLDASVPGISCVAVFDGHGGAKISLAAYELLMHSFTVCLSVALADWIYAMTALSASCST